MTTVFAEQSLDSTRSVTPYNIDVRIKKKKVLVKSDCFTAEKTKTKTSPMLMAVPPDIKKGKYSFFITVLWVMSVL